jgi:hypothetical protein
MAVPDGLASVLIGELGVPKRAAAALELPLPDLLGTPHRLGGCMT